MQTTANKREERVANTKNLEIHDYNRCDIRHEAA